MRLDLDEIARALGTSRMPVRGAIRRLDTEGLVTLRPHRGAVVTSMTPEDVLELFEMRAVLEGLAIRLALPGLDGKAIEDLEELLPRMDRARGDPKLWLERHDEFHDSLCRRSGRPRLVAEIARLRSTVRPYLLVYLSVYEQGDVAGFEHRTLIEAIENNDPPMAETTMRNHITVSEARVVEFLKRVGPLKNFQASR
jgi:DNA-binding GntR family transcriptional regulator